MGELGAGDTETDQAGLGRFQGDPRRNHGGRRSRRDARLPLVLGDRQCLPKGVDGFLLQIDIGVGQPQLDEGGGQQSLFGQGGVGQGRLVGLRGGGILFDQAAYLAP